MSADISKRPQEEVDHVVKLAPVKKQSPTFLAPGTDFVDDNFSTDWGWWDGLRMIQAHSIQAHLLLCVLVPNRP